MKGAEQPPAILLGGQGIAVSAARSLGRAGVAVTAAGDGRFDTVGASRYCGDFVDLGSGAGVQERWLDWLLGEERRTPAVLLPLNDDALEVVARNRELLVAAGHAPAHLADEVALAMLDKSETYERARAVGVGTPRTLRLNGPADLEVAASTFAFPCALKPVHSHLFARRYGLSQKLFVAASPADVRRLAEETREAGLEMIVTEIVPGPDDRLASYWCYRTRSGEKLFELTKRKVRQYPPLFGLGTYHVTDRDPAILEVGRRFCEGLGLEGICNVEFKRDERDGGLKVIECNQRLTLANEIFMHAGIDLPVMVYRDALGDTPEPVRDYPVGVRLWFPVEDTRTFLAYRSRGELTTAAWVRSLLHRQHFPLLSLTDPGPALASWRRFPGRLSRLGPVVAGPRMLLSRLRRRPADAGGRAPPPG